MDLFEERGDVDVAGRHRFAAGGGLSAGPPPQPEHREHVGWAACEADDRRTDTFGPTSGNGPVEQFEEPERVAGERGQAVRWDRGDSGSRGCLGPGHGADQQRPACLFIEAGKRLGIGHATGHGEDLSHDVAVGPGVLSDVEPRHVEAEGPHQIEPVRGGRMIRQAVVLPEALDEQGNVGLEFASRCIRGGGRRLGETGGTGTLQSEADHPDPPAIDLVGGERFEHDGQVGPGGGERGQPFDERLGAAGGVERDREQVVELRAPVEVAIDRRRSQPQERPLRDVGGDERIPVAVASHPRSEREKGPDAKRFARIAFGEAAAERGMDLRNRLPEPGHDR